MDHDECMTTQSNISNLTADYNGQRREDFEKKAKELEVKSELVAHKNGGLKPV